MEDRDDPSRVLHTQVVDDVAPAGAPRPVVWPGLVYLSKLSRAYACAHVVRRSRLTGDHIAAPVDQSELAVEVSLMLAPLPDRPNVRITLRTWKFGKLVLQPLPKRFEGNRRDHLLQLYASFREPPALATPSTRASAPDARGTAAEPRVCCISKAAAPSVESPPARRSGGAEGEDHRARIDQAHAIIAAEPCRPRARRRPRHRGAESSQRRVQPPRKHSRRSADN